MTAESLSAKKPEILAPAGSPEQLQSAVRAGADAVYLGAGSMNARRSAKNFTAAELSEACAFCHERGVRVYLTVNTVVFDDEQAELEQIAHCAAEAGVDAFIVQDTGVAAYLRTVLPDIVRHASTQMSIHTPSGVLTAARLGFSRVILARELSLAELEDIAQAARECGVELECFVHGALCMSVSGQCYLSSVLGARSGNRGRCAQPCRLGFKAGEREMCLSLKDMSSIEHIARLKNIGVSSLKIEGRMKRPEYCAAAVTAVRCARDGEEYPLGLEQKLSRVFSRQGFTDGYLTARRGADMFGFRSKDDVLAGDSKLMSSLHELTRTEFARVPVSFELRAVKNEPLSLGAFDSDGNSVQALGDAPLPSEKDCNETALAERLGKTGGTPYVVKNAACRVEKGLYIPASAINSLRRKALELLSERRRAPKRRHFEKDGFAYFPHEPKASDVPVSCVFADISMLPQSFPRSVDTVYLPLETDADKLSEAKSALCQSGIELALEAPRGCFGAESRIIKQLEGAKSLCIDKIMAQNLGTVALIKSAGLNAVGGFGLNITNSRALAEYEAFGLCEAELSLELTLARVVRLGGRLKRGVLIYGRLPLMLCRNCPAALSGHCAGTAANCSISDRYDIEFPVRCRGGCAEVFNSIPMSIVDKKEQIRNIDRFFTRFTVENSVEIEEIFEMLNECPGRNNPKSNQSFTRGLAFRPVE